jgi:hypothetical protein
MAGVVYLLCALTALLCAGLLLRAYGRGRVRLLLWSGVCFVGLALNNVLVFVDLVVAPQVDLFLWRNTVSLLAMGILVVGLIWDAK